MSGYLVTVGRGFMLWLRPPAIPKDWSDALQVAEYRSGRNDWMHAMSATSIGLFAIILIVSAAVFDWLPDSFDQVAWGAETDRKIEALDKKRDEKLATLTTDIDAIRLEQKNLAVALRVARASTLSGQIFNAKKEQCAVIGDGRNARVWTEQLRRLEQEYRDLIGEKFDTPLCGEL